ncbi:class I SAM-dependent methyltransferase [Neosynechococcus sphagnicola]|nr:class I SAM-dependent methyltransferase [Neosynechococcus sphagnicola]
MTLDSIVPFGRSLLEYQRMFNLSPQDLGQRILGCGDGPASFNAELHQLGCDNVISIDPIYAVGGEVIQQRFEQVVDDIIAQVKATPEDWVWRDHHDPEALRRHRLQTLQMFLQDYELGRQTGRYQVASLPTLPFADQQFDLALCSHLLFLYSDHLDYTFHLDSIQELCRVATQVRIFPLITLALQRSPYIDALRPTLADRGITSDIIPVAYELQKGGNEMVVFSQKI